MIILNCKSIFLLFEIGVLTAVKVLGDNVKIRPAHFSETAALPSTLSEMTGMIRREGWT